MAEQNFPDNTVYELDNLDVLRGMNSETVDLIATDPPFNTKRNRSGSAGFYVDKWKWGDEGKLPDQWAWNEVQPIWLEEIKDQNPALYEVIEAAAACHGDDIAAFLCFLSVRLLEMNRVLKPTGSLYLHCDHTANAYIRMALDAIFGAKNFRNEVVWERSGGKSDAKRFGAVHDTIFYYSKTSARAWNPQYIPHDPEYIASTYKHNDQDGRGLYCTMPLHAEGPSGGESGTPWKGYSPAEEGNHWRTPTKGVMGKYIQNNNLIEGWPDLYPTVHTRLEALDNAKLIAWSDNGVPRLKTYLSATKGIALTDLIKDIPMAPAGERTGSPDQKPLALYQRIILASSNPGDLVLDPFAGCATTIIAAKKNGRRWVGIDRRKDARFHVVCRMMGVRAKDAEKLRQRPDLADWMNGQLAHHESNFRTDPPVRTDEGDTAAPFLAPVYTLNQQSALTHHEMKNYLLETFGLQCWGCNFKAPDPRYLQLDHAEPKADGGSNHLDNRALLCQPCNQAKSNRITISELRRRNTKEGHLTKPTGTPRGQDGHPINLLIARQNCREALERHRRNQPLQMALMM